MSTVSKKKKVKKLKKKKAGVNNPDNMDGEYLGGPSGKKLSEDINESGGFNGLSSDEGPNERNASKS